MNVKAGFAKIIIALAAVALTVPFVAVALAVGARAVERAASSREDLLLVALAVLCAAASVAKNTGRAAETPGRLAALRGGFTDASSRT
ncbi:MAG TPA: hypothetical protein VER08_05150 [Pyrinomonadaceae bacterium]|nr:hypothetical protein [Pyrinomonadaceae bacterium]